MRVETPKIKNMNKNFDLTEDEVFFGIIGNDDVRSSFLNHQPSMAEIVALAEQHPRGFSHACECGATAYLYSHAVNAKDGKARSSIVHFACPACGRRIALGANYFLMQEVVEMLRQNC